MSRPVPLRYRLPNPPPLYAGREEDEAWVRQGLASRTLSVLVGEAGIGKSALVARALREHAPVLHVDVPRHEPPEDLRVIAARALLEVTGGAGFDWGASAGGESFGAVVVDLAEQGGYTVVLEDVHHADPESVRALVGDVGERARASRWVLVSREPVGAPAERRLGPLDDAALARLAEGAAPELDAAARRARVRRAEGSPWRLLQLLRGDDTDPLADLPEPVREGVRGWAALRVPVSAALLERAFGLDAAARELLVARGLAEPRGALLRLHDLAREAAGPPELGALRAAGAVLADRDEPADAFEAARLLRRAGDEETLEAHLRRRGGALLAAGYAHRLWRALAGARRPFLARFRVRCAVELGDPAMLPQLAPPEDEAGESWLLWAKALYGGGRFEEAAEAASRAAALAEEADDARGAFEGAFLHARALANQSRWAEAVKAFDEAVPLDDADRTRRAAVVARCLVWAGEVKLARVWVAAVRDGLEALEGRARVETGYALADLARELGQVEEAEALFAAADEEARHVLPLLYSTWGRRALFQRATFDLARGAFDACRAHLRALAPFTGGASLLQPHLTLLGVGLDLASGVGEGTRAACVEVCEAARSRKSRGLATIGAAWAFRVAMALREEPPVRVAAEERVDPGTYLGAAHALAEARWRVRRGEDAPEVDLTAAPLPELAREAELLAAERALLAGRDEEARRHADAAARRAEETGAVPAQAEALELAAAAQLLAGRREAARERGEELAALAEASGARAWAEEAELIALLAAPADPVAMARFAAEAGAAPGARARAQALLGEREARLDAVDRRVLEAARASGWGRWRRAPAVDEGGGAWSVAQSGEVRLAPDRRVDLGRRPLLARLLRALGARDVATKEELVLGAWEVTSYHPLRHDNRLQVAIRTLRRELEDDPSEPRRIRTVPEGYALGGPVWFEHEDDP